MMIDRDMDWGWVRDAWGNWVESIDDRELPEECRVRFTFATTQHHKVERVLDRRVAENILNREMTPEVEEFLQSDEGHEIAEWFAQFNNPRWGKYEDEPVAVSCVEVLVQDHEGGE